MMKKTKIKIPKIHKYPDKLGEGEEAFLGIWDKIWDFYVRDYYINPTE
jgi:hypothetical protein